MTNQTYNRVEKISNHGLEQGIVPRFILQFTGIKDFVFTDKNECEYKFGTYINVIINDLIPLLDSLGYDKNSEVYRKLYRDMGYSLFGYWEVFYWVANNSEADKYVPNPNGLPKK